MMLANLSSILSAIETEIGPISLPNNFKVFDDLHRALVRGLGLTLSPTTAAQPAGERKR
jgi:hypothetical protein